MAELETSQEFLDSVLCVVMLEMLRCCGYVVGALEIALEQAKSQGVLFQTVDTTIDDDPDDTNDSNEV